MFVGRAGLARPAGPLHPASCKYCRRRWRPANSFNACERWEMRQRGASPSHSLARSSPPVTIFPSLTSTNLDRVPGPGSRAPRHPGSSGRSRDLRSVSGRGRSRAHGWLRYELRQRAARSLARWLAEWLHCMIGDRSLTLRSGEVGRASAEAGIPQVDTSLTSNNGGP